MCLVHRFLVSRLTLFEWDRVCLGTPNLTLSGLSCARSRYTFHVGIHNGILPKVRPRLDPRSRPKVPSYHICLGPGLHYPHPPPVVLHLQGLILGSLGNLIGPRIPGSLLQSSWSIRDLNNLNTCTEFAPTPPS